MYARVAIDCPLFTLFDYRIPQELLGHLVPGMRVRVPFGKRCLTGVVMQRIAEPQCSPQQLKSIQDILDPSPILDSVVIELLNWSARYYLHPPGQVVFNALPPELRKNKPIIADREERFWLALDNDPALLKRAPKQATIWRWLKAQGHACSEASILARFTSSRPILQALEQKGFAQPATSPQPDNQAADPSSTEQGIELNPEQSMAAHQILSMMHAYRSILLDGVTGSGKTEVYIAAMQAALQADRQVLLLVPEIGLTPQLQIRLQKSVGHEVGLLHSSLTNVTRLKTWLQAKRGNLRILIGTRSAVFTPLPDLGLIIIDEEHDASFKQQDGFLYHARDVAIYRAHQQNIPVLLGSATPSFESLHNVAQGRYHCLRLTQRAGDAALPSTTLIDMRNVTVNNGLSRRAIERMREHLQRDRQVMLFLNRRGYAPTLLCHACGWMAECTRCDARMTLHKTKAQLICHHCERSTPVPEMCPHCGQTDLHPIGEGTQRIEETLSEQFPGIPITRLDRDSTRKKGSLESIIASIQDGTRQIIIGTQMIAKGHDFPNMSLVVIVNLDYGFFSADFRAMERVSQLLIQVAGRAGRRTDPGEVLIQTHFPDHHYMQTLLHEGYHAFAQLALENRKLAGLPPFVFHIALRARAQKPALVTAFLKSVRKLSRDMEPEITVLGPIPSVMERKAGFSRAYLIFSAPTRAQLGRHFACFVEQIADLSLARKVNWSIDVDPLDSE